MKTAAPHNYTAAVASCARALCLPLSATQLKDLLVNAHTLKRPSARLVARRKEAALAAAGCLNAG
jgi:hypothetical protein